MDKNIEKNKPDTNNSISGLRKGLHGTIYQSKLLVFFFKRGVDKGYHSFRLDTETDTGCFDDIFFEFDTENGKIIRLIQAKHTTNDDKKITKEELLKDGNCNFGLPKYFSSYRDIIRNPQYTNDDTKIQDFIIFTNMDIDPNLNANFDSIENDDILHYNERECKLLKIKDGDLKKQIIQTLTNNSNLCRLAKYLSEAKNLNFKNELLKPYQNILTRDIFEVIKMNGNNYVQFSESFLNSEELIEFKTFFFQYWMPGEKFDINKMKSWKKLALNFLNNEKPVISNIKDFVKEITIEIVKAKDSNKIVYLTKDHKVIKDNIDKLSEHLLVTKNVEEKDLYYFNQDFFDDTSELKGNLNEFRSELKEELRKMEVIFTRDEYKFCIKNFPYQKNSLPTDYVTDEEIEGFLNKLVFAVNQPNEVELGKIIVTELAEDLKLIDVEFFASHLLEFVLDWIKTDDGEFLTHKKGKQFFEDAKYRIAKLIFNGPTLEYLKIINELNINFKPDAINELQLGLETFLSSQSSIQVLNIINETIILGSAKLYQILNCCNKYDKEDSYIFLRLNSVLLLEKRIMQVFSTEKKVLVIIACEIEKNEDLVKLETLLNNLKVKLTQNSHNQIILITDTKNDFIEKQFLNYDKYSEYKDDKNNFTNLTDDTQKILLERGRFLFQGSGCLKIVSDFEDNDSDKIDQLPNTLQIDAKFMIEKLCHAIDRNVLVKLINSEIIRIGTELNGLGEIEPYYMNRTLTRRIIIDEDFRKEPEKFYIIEENIDNRNFAHTFDQFEIDPSYLIDKHEIKIINLNDSKDLNYQDINNTETLPSEILQPDVIFISDNNTNQFAYLCCKYNEKNIHWLVKNEERFIWQQSYGNLINLRSFIQNSESDLNFTNNWKVIISRAVLLIKNLENLFEPFKEILAICLPIDDMTNLQYFINIVNILTDSRISSSFVYNLLENFFYGHQYLWDIAGSLEPFYDILNSAIHLLNHMSFENLFCLVKIIIEYLIKWYNNTLIYLLKFLNIANEYCLVIQDIMNVFAQFLTNIESGDSSGLEYLNALLRNLQIFYYKNIDIANLPILNDKYLKLFSNIANALSAFFVYDVSLKTDKVFNEIKTVKFKKDKVVIIVAKPGMGKSTFLTHLAIQTKKLKPHLWILNINLIDYASQFKMWKDKKFILNETEAKKFLYSCTSLKNNNESLKELEKGLFDYFYDKGKMIVLVDGFDEISPNYKKVVLKLLKVLKNSSIGDLWITTRPYDIQYELENDLCSFSYTLTPISRQNQIDFLKSYWKQSLNLNKLGEFTNIFIDELLNRISKTTNDCYHKFFEVPLQLRMIADDFKQILGEKLNIVSLYESFINIKFYKILMEEKKVGFNLNDPHMKKMIENERMEVLEHHKKFALLSLFGTDGLDMLNVKIGNSVKNIVLGNEKTGIIDRVIDEKPIFIHRSYAEYFAALWFTSNWKENNKVKTFLIEHIFKDENYMTRKFFDNFLVYESNINELENEFESDSEGENDEENPIPILKNKYELHAAILNNDVEGIKKILESENLFEIISSLDKGGRTALHLIASYNYTEIYNLINSEQIKFLIDKEDKIFGWSPLIYAEKCGNWNIVEMLLESGAKSDEMFKEVENINGIYCGPNSRGFKTPLLHIVSRLGFQNLTRIIIKKGDINCLSDVVNGEENLLELIAQGINTITSNELWEFIKEKYGNNYAPLHLCVQEGQTEIVKIFIKFIKTKIPRKVWKFLNAKQKNGSTVLHLAAHKGKPEVVEFLLKLVEEIKPDKLWEFINEKLVDDYTVLHLIAKAGQTEVADLLLKLVQMKFPEKVFEFINAKEKNGCTALNIAAEEGKTEIVELILKLLETTCPDKVVEFINAKEKSGCSALHIPVEEGRTDVDELLFQFIESKFSTNISEFINANAKNGLTILHIAVTQCQMEIVEFLIKVVESTIPEKMLEFINAKDQNGVTALHLAAKEGIREIVGLLISTLENSRPDKLLDFINETSNDGRTALHLALMFKYPDIIKILIKYNVNVVAKDDQSSVLHKTVSMNNVEILEVILNEIRRTEPNMVPFINARDTAGDTPLMWASDYGHVEMVKMLLEHGVNLDIQNNNGETALHWATKGCYYEIVKLLLNGNANSNINDNNGKTPIRLAVEIWNTDPNNESINLIVKLLSQW